jgi:hypothetical protein
MGNTENNNIKSSSLKRAIQNDSEALMLMFKQFLPADEVIYYTQYLGTHGLWGTGTHSFGCLTERRVADITVGRFGEVTYQDGYLESINSSVIYQPSKSWLYIWIVILGFTAIMTFGIALLFIYFVAQAYYRLAKCGVVFNVKEGISVYIFCDRKHLGRVNALCRNVMLARENRIKVIKKMHGV